MADPVTMTVMAASAGLSAYGSVRQGQQAAAAGKYNQAAAYNEAKGLEIQAGQEIAAGTHNSVRIAERAKEILSRQQALAASGGGSSQDATVQAIKGETVKRSTLEQLLEMASAEETAQQIRQKADITRRGGDMARIQGNQARTASYIQAGTTLMNAGVSWADKFGTGGGGSPAPPHSAPVKASYSAGGNNRRP